LHATTAALAGAVAVVGDVSIPQDAQRVVQEATGILGGLDVLVCNVGSGRSVPPGTETADEWHRVFAVNLWSTTNTVAAARAALQTARGCIVCISSICGLEVIAGAPVTYSAAKAALHAYVRGIARPLGKQGVRINAVAPGNILFDGSVWSRKLAADAAGVNAMLERDVALARLGTPREIAELVAYLASPRAAFATGGIWTLDGGQVH
jgi:NAD(P)-dependent dehydrogenase (short-subunit alcohol dehydrogenase family)